MKSAIMEIRAGAGGDEAGLFAADLLNMYTKFAQSRNWGVKELSRSAGGLGQIKEVRVEFSSADDNPYETLKHESGVHRVQRVPETEKSGRIHTSTATVAVLPKVSTDIAVNIQENDLKIEVFGASGPGGQHMQKSQSAVRITHKPTGTTVECQDSRSQIKNRETAMKQIKAKLLKNEIGALKSKIKKLRSKQIGTGARSEKIRTYNFPQDRITDHRINKSWGNLKNVIDGDVGKIVKKVKTKLEK